ncbi:MAG: bifunctional precorrin-2 dehydrogenase/sirohydrochlorin ferrochelatase [Magnetococcales bacterium]|nr:bifunctional precorrin-2 dehydrogenase/sirohydrochlorin ferrochelatase [Magnetococcales bacterium]
MSNYMAELILTNREVLLIGGGTVALRKLTGLLITGARVLIVSPKLDPQIAKLVQEKRVEYLNASFGPQLLEHKPRYTLVFAATSIAETNRQIAKICAKEGILCNSADDPKVSGFLVPAMVRRGPITVGVGTKGESPALSRLIKERIDSWLEPGWGELAQLFGFMRSDVKKRINPIKKRQDFWRNTTLAVAKEERFKKTDNKEWLEKRICDAE